MKFEIKSRISGSVLFALETESLKLCVEAAVKSGANLSGANLSYAHLRDTDLRGANLSSADLSGANLSGANLSYANLRVADLSDTDLRVADLRGADLSYAHLSSADLYGANLSYANLYGADLSSANLYGADLSSASLSSADLRSANDEKLILAGERPIIQIGPLGSRCAYLLAFMTDRGIYVRAGCFWGTLETFEVTAKKTHGNNIHGKEYAAAIAMIKAHAKLWTPKKEKGK